MKASDCIDFSAKEYSVEDGDNSEHVEWKRTYRMLLKGSPAVQELYRHMSSDVSLMARSFVVDEAFPPVPFEEPRKNATALAYSAFHDPRNRPAGPLGSFLGWLRTVASASENQGLWMHCLPSSRIQVFTLVSACAGFFFFAR